MMQTMIDAYRKGRAELLKTDPDASEVDRERAGIRAVVEAVAEWLDNSHQLDDDSKVSLALRAVAEDSHQSNPDAWSALFIGLRILFPGLCERVT